MTEAASPAPFSTLLFHASRREELCKLKLKEFRYERRRVPHLTAPDKGGETRHPPVHAAPALIYEYLETAGHGEDETVSSLSSCKR